MGTVLMVMVVLMMVVVIVGGGDSESCGGGWWRGSGLLQCCQVKWLTLASVEPGATKPETDRWTLKKE